MPQKVAIWLLVLNMGCGTVGTTIISPALSSITEQFSVDKTDSQSLLSVYFISLAFFQLFYGVLSDRYGRRQPLFVGLTTLALGGLIAALAESFEILILARILQGFGAASVYSIIRAIINDSYDRLESASALALITGIMLIVPICSFAFGGLITDLVSWRGVMLGIFLAGLVPLVLNVILLPETNLQPLKKVELRNFMRDYLALMTNRLFLAFMLASSCCVGIWFTMIGFIPFEYQRIGVDTAEVGFWFMLSPIGFAFGNFLTKRLVHQLGLESMAQLGGLLSIFAISALLLPSLISVSHPILIGIPSFFFGFSAGFVMATTTMGAIASAGELGGSASGIVGATQMGFGVLGGTIVVGVGGYEQFENGVAVLIGLALLSTTFSTFAKRLSRNPCTM